MPWNEPGSGKSPNSGNGRKRPTNEVEDIINSIKGGFGGGNKGGGNTPNLPSWLSLPAILIAGAIIIGMKSVYTVKEGEESVVLRLGKYNRTDNAGLNLALWPIESKFLVATSKLRTMEVGYSGNASQNKAEASMLTNDKNIVDITMAVQYTIQDLKALLFNVEFIESKGGTLDSIVRGATESALREVVGSKRMDDVITKDRLELDSSTQSILQGMLDRYNTGIRIESVESQNSVPPSQVKDSFDDVVNAGQDKERKINNAQAYANDLIPKARGEASRITQEAEGYNKTIVAEATGEAERFNQILAEYRKAPEITKKRLYLETMEEVLSGTSKVMVDSKSGNSLMYLPIDKLIEQRGASRAAPQQIQKTTSQTQQSKVNQRNPLRSTTREAR